METNMYTETTIGALIVIDTCLVLFISLLWSWVTNIEKHIEILEDKIYNLEKKRDEHDERI